MSMESNLQTLLESVTPQVFADVADEGTIPPYVTWQGIGGESIRFIDNTTGDKRDTLVQVSVWTKTRASSLSIIRSIENTLCSTSLFQARPEGEPASTFEVDTKLYGSIQRFSILG